MLGFVLPRTAPALVVIACVIFVVSVLIKLIPGDPVDIMSAGNPGITAEQKQRLREELGLTRPLLTQFATYLNDAAHGDLGESIRFRVPAMQLVLERLPATLELTIVSMLIAVLIAIPLGVVTALRQGSAVDYVGSVFAVIGISVPSFLLGILLILFLSVDLNLLPASGRGVFLPTAIGRAIGTGNT